MAQSVEHVLGKDGVTGSNPVISSKKRGKQMLYLFFYKIKAMPEVGERVLGRAEDII